MRLPNFDAIKANVGQINRQLTELLQRNRHDMEQLLQQPESSWQNFMEPLDAIEERLHHFWAPIAHLHAVADTPALREQYEKASELITQYTS